MMMVLLLNLAMPMQLLALALSLKQSATQKFPDKKNICQPKYRDTSPNLSRKPTL
jgi:hypothetical protein